MYYRYTVRFS